MFRLVFVRSAVPVCLAQPSALCACPTTFCKSLHLSPISRTEFYREELIKHQQCLQALRESFSPRAIAEVEQAIHNTLAQLDRLCDNCDCNHIDQVVSCLLRKLDQVTNLSAWSDPKTLN